MQTIDKIHPIETIRKLLPITKLVQDENEIRYRFKSEASARYFENRAIEMILKQGLPLVTVVEVWSTVGVVFEINLVISMAPEETSI